MAKPKKDDAPKTSGSARTQQNKDRRMASQKVKMQKAAQKEMKKPRGYARAMRRGNPAPSFGTVSY